MTKKTLSILITILFLLGLGSVVFIFGNNKNMENNNQNQQESIIENSAVNNNSDIVKNFSHKIILSTTLGDVELLTYDADAPKAVSNFISLAEKGFYNNVIFHRIIKGFMVQGGDPTGTGMGGPGYQFEDELNSNTESYKNGYQKGVLAMANSGPNTNGSQFFIMLADYPLQHDYTIFGKVTKGQEIIDAMGELQTDKNDRPLNPPTIKKITVEKI